jgi:hypothetical protein
MNKLAIKNSLPLNYQKTFSKIPDVSLLWLSLIPIIAILLSIITTFILSSLLPKKLPLFYSLAWGEKQLATQPQLLIIPASIAVLTLVNLIIFWRINKSQILLRKILVYSTIVITLVVMVSFSKIILTFI